MNCPGCGTKYACPCSACKESNVGNGLEPWIRSNETFGSFDESCPKCGLTKDVHDWMSLEVEQLRAEGKWPASAVNTTGETKRGQA